MAGFGFGPFIINFVATALINPEGKPVGDDLLYPPEVNERFEYMMEILGVIYFGFVICGIILIHRGPVVEQKKQRVSEFVESGFYDENEYDKLKNLPP